VAEQEPLADGGAGGHGLAGVLDGLDALGHDHRVGPFGLGPDRVDDVGRLGGGPALEQAHVQLDQVGAHERQHGQGGRGGPDVVQGHPAAGLAGLGHGGQQPSRVAAQGPLGHLDHHPQPAPARQAAPNRAAGVSRAEASGPRASAS
jgi:hypothetical protein